LIYHAPDDTCGAEEHDALMNAWSLSVASLAWNVRPDLAPNTIRYPTDNQIPGCHLGGNKNHDMRLPVAQTIDIYPPCSDYTSLPKQHLRTFRMYSIFVTHHIAGGFPPIFVQLLQDVLEQVHAMFLAR